MIAFLRTRTEKKAFFVPGSDLLVARRLIEIHSWRQDKTWRHLTAGIMEFAQLRVRRPSAWPTILRLAAIYFTGVPSGSVAQLVEQPRKVSGFVPD